MSWSRDAQVDQQIQWARCFENAASNGISLELTPAGTRGRGRQGANETPVVRKGVTFAQVRMAEGDDATATRVKHEGMEIPFNQIDKSKWDTAYGKIRVAGKNALLCWYHCNRPGGCVREGNCSHDHSQYPAAYKAKPLIKCGGTFQKEVLAKCKST